MYSRTRSAVCFGMEGREVFVETDISRGLPGIGVVGLASTMVMESRERIRKAIENSGYEYPKGRITVNLTPASLRKNSSCLDLPIAIGILASEGNIRVRVAEDWAVIGELALDGRVLGVEGALPMMLHMKRALLISSICQGLRHLRHEAVYISGTDSEHHYRLPAFGNPFFQFCNQVLLLHYSAAQHLTRHAGYRQFACRINRQQNCFIQRSEHAREILCEITGTRV